MSTENQPVVKVTQIARIGDWVKKNQADIAIAAGFVLVALISFGVGYLSAPGQTKNPIVIEKPQGRVAGEQVTSDKAGDTASASILQNAVNAAKSEKGILVASKNGKKYYWPWSPLAKKIKPENIVWFKSEAEAQASGRTKSADFDEQAPAGYQRQ